MGLDLRRRQLEHPAPGGYRFRLVAELAQGAGQPPPSRPVVAGLGQGAKVHEGAGLQPLARKQLGQPVERVGIAGVEVQHLAPDLVGLGPLVLFLQGAGVTFPGLDFRGIGLGRSLQMGERLRRPAIGFEDRGEPFVALRIGGKQRQHAAPGFRLAGDV